MATMVLGTFVDNETCDGLTSNELARAVPHAAATVSVMIAIRAPRAIVQPPLCKIH
jgi:hypothetical protein